MSAVRAVITGSAHANPPARTQRELWDGFFAEHFSDRRAARLAFDSSGVVTRHAAVDPLVEDISSWSTGARMDRYLLEAMPLGKEAVLAALGEAGISAADLGFFAVVSCTGYTTPGLDVRLARDLGMSRSLRRINIGHMGCHAALPALAVTRDFVVARGEPALLLCLELSSLHIQPPTTDLSQAIIHALFSDAAAAIVVEPTDDHVPTGLEVVDFLERSDLASAEHMAWEITDHGFRMTLSRKVNDVIERQVEPLIDELLGRNSLSRESVAGWAVHPGGPRILDTLVTRLGLREADLAASKRTLEIHGNCSSATVLLALDDVWRGLGDLAGAAVVMLAFGPGLTLSAALLRTSGTSPLRTSGTSPLRRVATPTCHA